MNYLVATAIIVCMKVKKTIFSMRFIVSRSPLEAKLKHVFTPFTPLEQKNVT